MTTNPITNRVWAAFIGANAAFVAFLGLLRPALLDEKFTWAVLPPLHARFVGALYLFGAVALLGSALCRRWADVAPLLVGTGLFTTSMFVLTMLNREAFDFGLAAPLVWLTAYVVFPLVSWSLVVALHSRQIDEAPGPGLPSWFVAALRSLAVLFVVVGVGLLVARSVFVGLWPWKVSNSVAQFYGGPFLTLAWCAWAYSGRRSMASLRPYLLAMAALGASVIVCSIRHRSLFDVGDPAAWVWFALFLAITVAAAALLPRAFGLGRQGREVGPTTSLEPARRSATTVG